ncbi:MAG: NRDE family protein [Myxococcales bacterium]|nr:NRDE family protein [Myxococcales bacterium]
MCTIIVRHGMDDFCSTIIASNRDEFYDRAASGPRVLRVDPLVVGGRDEREGGTWFGLSRTGVFVGLTNQRTFGSRDDSLRSRGGLVVDALAEGSLEGAEQYLRSVDPAAYNEFNLIFGDGNELRAAYARRDAREIEIETLAGGVHVLCNDRLGSPEFPKAEKARARVLAVPPDTWPRMKRQLVEVLSDGSLPDPSEVPPIPPDAPFDQEVARYLQAICVKTPVYGTVSSTIAAVSPGRVEQYWFSHGPPSETSFEDVRRLTQAPE